MALAAGAASARSPFRGAAASHAAGRVISNREGFAELGMSTEPAVSWASCLKFMKHATRAPQKKVQGKGRFDSFLERHASSLERQGCDSEDTELMHSCFSLATKRGGDSGACQDAIKGEQTTSQEAPDSDVSTRVDPKTEVQTVTDAPTESRTESDTESQVGVETGEDGYDETDSEAPETDPSSTASPTSTTDVSCTPGAKAAAFDESDPSTWDAQPLQVCAALMPSLRPSSVKAMLQNLARCQLRGHARRRDMVYIKTDSPLAARVGPGGLGFVYVRTPGTSKVTPTLVDVAKKRHLSKFKWTFARPGSSPDGPDKCPPYQAFTE
ncbi:hypothetical protein FNF28_06479 [Cafeteria roenbergensis]|uniref:Uncharacterized protein n=1 Tax=Cafeteria roenbergensis TaxID=33653 RepID=A0A5A8CY31_CAFRO|nr:hypothetical protein FNF28_06479 [Cafeteria roenbergensis]